MDNKIRIIWNVLKAAAIPLSAAYIAWWYTASARWSTIVLIVMVILELAVCVYAGCYLGAQYDAEERRRWIRDREDRSMGAK